jgi:hypothetical protein
MIRQENSTVNDLWTIQETRKEQVNCGQNGSEKNMSCEQTTSVYLMLEATLLCKGCLIKRHLSLLYHPSCTCIKHIKPCATANLLCKISACYISVCHSKFVKCL